MSLQSAQPSTAFLQELNKPIRGSAGLVVVGTTGTASTSVTGTGSLAGVAIGAVVTGLDIVNTPPTTVVDLDDTLHTLALSQNATTGHAATPLTFTNPPDATGFKVGLFTGNPTLTKDTVLADLVALAPVYTGYARQAVALEALRSNANGDQIDPMASASFQPSDAVGLPVTVTGCFLTAVIGGVETLLLSERFDTPFNFITALSGLDVDMDVYIRNITAYGGICSTC